MKTTQCLEHVKQQTSTLNRRPPQPAAPHCPGWAALGLALLLILGSAARSWADQNATVNLTLTSPGTYNTINSSLTIYVNALGEQQAGTGTPMQASGNQQATLAVNINPVNGAVNSVDQITFTGGLIALSNPSYTVTGYGFGIYGGFNVTGSSLTAEIITLSPPTSVSGGSFDAGSQDLSLDGGTISVLGTGLIGSSMNPNPMLITPSPAYPMNMTSSGSGSVQVSLVSLVNRMAIYSVQVLMPVNCPNQQVAASSDATVSMSTSGTLQMVGTFTNIINGTSTWNGSGDMNWTQPDSTSWSGQPFYSGDTAQFLGAGLGTVNIPATVTPAAVSVNAAGDYTFSGIIACPGNLTKSGTGTLTLAGPETYAGGATINGGTLEVQSGFCPAYSYFRFTPTALRGPSPDSVQLSELQFYVNGTWVAADTVTNPGGSNSGDGAPANANDNDLGAKWLDFNKGALVYSFNSPQAVTAYNWATANDMTERDPIRWKVEASNDGSTWTMVDDKTGADQPVTSARQTWQGPGNTQFPGWALPSFGSGPVSIAGGATLRLNPSTVAPPGCGQISGAGTLDLNSTVSGNWGALNLASGFTGKLLLEKGRVNSNPTTLGGTTSVELRSGAQMLFYDGTANTYTYPQSYTIAGTGWGESAFPAALRVSGQSAILDGPVTLAGDATVLSQDSSGQLTFNGIISGGYNLTLQASGGAITFGAANTYSGATTLTAGTLNLAHGLALQNSTLNNGGTIAFDHNVGDHAFTFGGLGGSGNISLQDDWSNPVTLTVGANNTNTTYSGNLSGGGSLTKNGAGMLTLAGANTYTGTTTVNAGTLAINGSLDSGSGGAYFDTSAGTLRVNGTFTSSGDVTITGTLGGAGTINANVSDYGTLFPNSPGGTLTVNGSLSLMSKTVMALNRDSGSPLGDHVSATTLYRYSSLLVTNTGVSSLRSGDSFTLFNWTSASGSFSPVTLPPLMPGLTWVNQLSTLGKLSISGTAIPPRIRSSVYSDSNVTFSGTGGVARGTYYVLASTNVAALKSTWTPVATNLFDASGNFSFNASVSSGPRQFYAIAVP